MISGNVVCQMSVSSIQLRMKRLKCKRFCAHVVVPKARNHVHTHAIKVLLTAYMHDSVHGCTRTYLQTN